jgi:hypothetical protein
MLEDCTTNQYRKGDARAQIIADAAHCRGCRRFWAGGRQRGENLENLGTDGTFTVVLSERRYFATYPPVSSRNLLRLAFGISVDKTFTSMTFSDFRTELEGEDSFPQL